ncbi:FAD/NAD(P)-binding domain-containing protein [Xylariaceae sp. AK1471]|nr:FAD/NAD(P)-binding domain-containing protein [Xylariaceae sp. AK1471]
MEKKGETPPFRVIIVGGGLLGLTAAHMFAKMPDVDYVVLEQHDDLMPEIGSLLSLWPPTFRVLDQLGVLDAVAPVLETVEKGFFLDATDASVLKEECLSQLVEMNHGHGIRIVHRPHYVQALYQSLPASAKARIHVQKRVVRIDVTDNGVAVHCADGSVEHGSIVIGADGVHSRTRQAMQSLAAASSFPTSTSISENTSTDQPSPFTTTYRLLFGNISVLPGLTPNTNFECAAHGISTQILTGQKQAWFAVYEKLDAPTSKRLRWSEDDKEGILKKWGHLYMAPGYTLKDVHQLRHGAVGLINLEEGLLDTWAWKRIVLVGDAVRKLEPHAGLGYNGGVADLVVLVNDLRRLLITTTNATATPLPTTKELEDLFRAYQTQRMDDTLAIVKMSEQRARMCAWLTTKDWLMARFVVPYLPIGTYSVNHILGPVISRTPVLEWLSEKQLPARAVPYVHHPKLGTREEQTVFSSEKKKSVSSASVLPLLTGTLVFVTLATVGFRFYRRM